jgi:hypothetical protein
MSVFLCAKRIIIGRVTWCAVFRWPIPTEWADPDGDTTPAGYYRTPDNSGCIRTAIYGIIERTIPDAVVIGRTLRDG